MQIYLSKVSDYIVYIHKTFFITIPYNYFKYSRCTINNYLLSLIKTKIKLPKYDTYRQNSVFFSPEFYFSSTVVIKKYFHHEKSNYFKTTAETP